MEESRTPIFRISRLSCFSLQRLPSSFLFLFSFLRSFRISPPYPQLPLLTFIIFSSFTSLQHLLKTSSSLSFLPFFFFRILYLPFPPFTFPLCILSFLSFFFSSHNFLFIFIYISTMAGRDRTIRWESHDNQCRYWKSDFPAKLRAESTRSTANFIHVRHHRVLHSPLFTLTHRSSLRV